MESRRRGLWIARGKKLSPALEESFEPLRVELLVSNLEHVAPSARLEHAAAENLAQLGDVDLKAFRSRLRRLPAPELVDQAFGRDDLALVHEQEGEQGSLLVGSERKRAPLFDRLHRSENSELHPCPMKLTGRDPCE